jgi:predicted Zn-dependent peptidase
LIESSVLPCGIRLVTETMADVRSVAVAFWVGTGSRDEPGELAGASHFLEHLLFKGTERRSAAAIAEELDEVGGDCNAFTTKEYTTFYVRLLSEHLSLGLDILSDIMWAPALRPDDIEAERTVILDEILMHADEPADLAAERWQAALFPDHPLGTDTLGTATSVQQITRDDIRAFFELHYRPSNMVVSVAGDCTHDAVAADLEQRFAGGSGGAAPARIAPGPVTVALDVVRRSTEQAHLVYGMRSVSRFDERRWALAVLNHVLGGGLSSRLFQKVREQRGLAYSVWSERAAYEDTGSLAVVAGTAPDHVDEVLRLVSEELELLATDGVTARELAVAKGSLRAEMLLSGEDSGARMSRIGASLLLHGEVLSVDEVLARIDGVERAHVLEVAAELAQAPRTMSVVGPFDQRDFESHLPALAAR